MMDPIDPGAGAELDGEEGNGDSAGEGGIGADGGSTVSTNTAVVDTSTPESSTQAENAQEAKSNPGTALEESSEGTPKSGEQNSTKELTNDEYEEYVRKCFGVEKGEYAPNTFPGKNGQLGGPRPLDGSNEDIVVEAKNNQREWNLEPGEDTQKQLIDIFK